MGLCIRSLLCCIVIFSIHGGAEDRTEVSNEIEKRIGYGLGPATARPVVPPGVSFEDGLSEDEAVAVALSNNSELRATLADLNLAQADFVEAGLFVNPILQVLLGAGAKPFEFLLTAPIEALWQRPKRKAAAKLTLETVAQRLVASGLDLVRDVRLAHAGYSVAAQLAVHSANAADLAEQIADLMSRRLRAGDISEFQFRLTELEALSARDRAERLRMEVAVAWERLRFLMGSAQASAPVNATKSPDAPASTWVRAELLDIAANTRPELRAAELSIEAAGRRLGWERSRILAFIAPSLSSKGVGTAGIKTGPGLAAEVPLFNRNQGRISRAQAEMEQAALRYAALREQIESEVASNLSRFVQAESALERLREQLLPSAQASVSFSEKAYEVGNISYLDFQLAKQPLLDLQMREIEAVGTFHRARAELERAVGRKL